MLIADFDVHHGNGTQAIFWEVPTVFYYSIHFHPHYPGTGMEDERGAGPGRGITLNRPLPHGFPAARYRELFRNDIDAIARSFEPELVMISAGFDPHRLDPFGSLMLESEDFFDITRASSSACRRAGSSRLSRKAKTSTSSAPPPASTCAPSPASSADDRSGTSLPGIVSPGARRLIC